LAGSPFAACHFWHNYFFRFLKTEDMAKLKIILLAVVVAVGSCRENSKTSAAVKDSLVDVKGVSPDSIAAGCYSQIKGKDTALLQVQRTRGMVTGTLSYDYFEKDRNDGSFQGELVDDILRGWYLFKSEGIMSVREVAWQVKGDQLWPATGEMAEKADTMRFAQPGDIRFDSSRAFRKIECVL
jgi:hypothetical protein